MEDHRDQEETLTISYQALLSERFPEAVVVTNERFHVKEWNRAAAELYGWTDGLANGSEIQALQPFSTSRGLHKQALQELNVTGYTRLPPISVQGRVRNQVVEPAVMTLRSGTGEVSGYLFIHRTLDQPYTPVFPSMEEAPSNQQSFEQREKTELETLAADQASEIQALNLRLKTLLRSLPVAVWIADAEGRIVEKNEMVDKVWGEDAPLSREINEYREYRGWWVDGGEELKGEDWGLARAIAHGEVSMGELVDILRFDGERSTIVNSAAPIYDDDGKLIGGVAISQDVTTQRKLEHEARQTAQRIMQNEELLRSIFEANPAGVAVLAGEDLVFQTANPAYCALTPNTLPDVVGMRYEEVWPPQRGFQVKNLIQRVMKTGEGIQTERHKRVYPDKTVRYFSKHLYPLTWNGIKAVLTILWDTSRLEYTQRSAEQLAEEAEARAIELNRERARLHTILANAPSGVLLTNETGHFTMVNPAATAMLDCHVGADCFSPNPDYSFHYPDGRPYETEDLPLAVALHRGVTSRNVELLVRYRSGNEIILLMNAAPVLDQKGKILGAIAGLSDVTELLQAREALSDYATRLERSNRDLEDFASIASHDLQEPLRKVKSFGERLMESAAAKLDVEELDYLERMQSAAARMSSMLNDLLDYSRVSTKAQSPVLVDLMEIAGEVLSDLDISIERSGGKVEIGPLPQIEAEPFQMRQLLQNMIGNALKFSRPGVPPMVKVDAAVSHKKGSYSTPAVVLSIQDNGIGFDEQYTEAIFQPFTRLHGMRIFEGSGMGLAICRKIVERHGGEITASSQVGKGSTFRIVLPIRQRVVEELE